MDSPQRLSHHEFLTMAQSLITQGRFEEFVPLAEVQIGSEPDFAEARFVFALALTHLRRYAEAAHQLEEVLRLEPNRHQALFALATALQGAGRQADALNRFEQFLEFEPNAGPALLEAAKLASVLGQPARAQSLSLRLTRIYPQAPEGWFLLGSAYAANDQMERASNAFRRVLGLNPGDRRSLVSLFKVLVQLDRDAEAAALMLRAVTLEPNNAEYLAFLASATAKLGQAAEAEELYRRALALDPETAGSYSGFLQERGRFADAQRMLEGSVKRHALQGVAFYHLAELRSLTLDGKRLIDLMDPALADRDLQMEQQMYLHYALSRAYEAEGAYEQSMRSLDQANQIAYTIHNTGRVFDAEFEEEILRIRMERFSAAAFPKAEPFGSRSNQPIFIVGMIRSGTTLLDQILSSHPDVTSAGEQKFWGLAADRWSKSGANLSGKPLLELARAYESCLCAFSHGGRVTDKMPLNYHHLGLIHVCFPRAKIIHIKRNSLDTCLSIYSAYLGRGPNWIYDQSNIVANYRLYESLMEHWRRTIPTESFFELEYEELVGLPASSVREILEFCELPWSDACLHPERNTEPIKTPSRWQARQPINQRSVGRFEKFLPHLGGLKDLLDRNV